METKKDKWWQHLFLAIASPLIFLLIIEVFLRLINVNTDLIYNKNFDIGVPVWLMTKPDWVNKNRNRLRNPGKIRTRAVAWLENFEEARYIQYKLKPNIDALAVNPFNKIDSAKNITFRITSNSEGFRTREFIARRSGTLRIVSIGDSSTFGWGVNAASTWQFLLEQRLSRRLDKDVEVFSLGMPGYTTLHGLNVLRHYGWKLEPDILIISFGSNDGRHVLNPPGRSLAADKTFFASIRWTLMKLKTFRLMRKLFYSISDPIKRVQSRPGNSRKDRVRAVLPARYRENLKMMIEDARNRGVEVILMSVCNCGEYTNIMQEVALSENTPFIDTLQIFRESMTSLREGRLYPAEMAYIKRIYGETNPDGYVWLYVTSDGCHPNRIGTNIIADALAVLIQQMLVQRYHYLKKK